MRPSWRASRILLSDKITTKHPSERMPQRKNLKKNGAYETKLSNAQSAASKPTAAMASERLRGACGRDPSATFFGGLTTASTFPANIAPPKASTNQTRMSSPRNTVSHQAHLRWNCPSPCFRNACTKPTMRVSQDPVDQHGVSQR